MLCVYVRVYVYVYVHVCLCVKKQQKSEQVRTRCWEWSLGLAQPAQMRSDGSAISDASHTASTLFSTSFTRQSDVMQPWDVANSRAVSSGALNHDSSTDNSSVRGNRGRHDAYTETYDSQEAR